MRRFFFLTLTLSAALASASAEVASSKTKSGTAAKKDKGDSTSSKSAAKKSASSTSPRVYAPTKSSASVEKPKASAEKPKAPPTSPRVIVPTTPAYSVPPFFPWKRGITATVFWIGEAPSEGNPTPNHASAWDANWAYSYGGYDDPNPLNRVGYLPRFMPGQNPFYVALPYNDVSLGQTKPEAERVIPWFRRAFKKSGRSVCRGQWLAIRYKGKICFAQWEDVGPYETDDWLYVFGNARPRNTQNNGAGIDVSPAIRDYLKLASGGQVDWRFVSLAEVGAGPWKRFGENNQFVQLARANATRVGGERAWTPPPKPKTASDLYREREQWFKRMSGS